MSLPLPDVEIVFGRVRARLRALCGRDEIAAGGHDTRAALLLLDGLLSWPDGDAGALTAPERDRLLAEVWVRTFGPAVRSSPRCVGCGQPFDSDFSLTELVAAVLPAAPPTRVSTPDGRVFRVPSGADELAVAGLDREAGALALTRRCATDAGDADAASADAFSRALEAAVPVLDVELDASCPECGHVNRVGFRLQSFLLRALMRERQRLPLQMHRLARAYGWSAGEILALPRDARLELVTLAEAEDRPRRSA